MAEDEGRLVESGSFRVDAARAVKSLRARQLGPGFWRPGLFIRLAAACGASRFTLTRKVKSMTIWFDGRPIPPTTLAEPFGRLVGGEVDPVLRWFAWALLHSTPKGVSVTAASGDGARRRAFKYAPDGQSTAVPPTAGTGTEVALTWSPFLDNDLTSEHPAAWPIVNTRVPPITAFETGDPAPFPMSFVGYGVTRTHVPWEKRRPREGTFRLVDRRRTFCRLGSGEGKLRLALLGTRIEAMDLPEVPLPIDVTVDVPGLDVDASLDSPVQGPLFREACGTGRRAAEAFMFDLLKRHARAMKLTGAWLAVDARARLDWVESLGLIRGDEPGLLSFIFMQTPPRRPFRSGDRRRIEETGALTRLLRDAAVRTLGCRDGDRKDPLRDALWKAPLFFDGRGQTLSLEVIDPDSAIPSMTVTAGPPPLNLARQVWALSPMDAIYLKRRFRARPGAKR